MSREFKSPVTKNLWEYAVVTVSTLIMVFGNYFFKFPNNFAFGGITGFSTIVSALTKLSASQFTFIANMVLLVMGFIFIGKGFGMKTVYSSVLMSLALGAMDRWFPMGKPLTDQPILELVFAVFLPAVGSALLFNVGASSGGTDIIAMIFKKYTSFNIGTMLLLVDCFSVLMAFVVFDVTTGLFSTLGLIGKSLMIDGVIENINLCKCFNIVCDNPEVEAWAKPESNVSMNMWAGYPDFLDYLEKDFSTFLSNISDNPMKKEYLLPNIVAELLRENRINVKVLETHDKWFGVTYAEDKEYVQNAFKQLIEDGVYPEKLWK